MNNDEKTKDDALIRAPKERGLATRSAALTKRGLESLQSHYRIVRFPSDVSIGDAYLFDRNSSVSEWHKYLQSRQQLRFFSDVEEIENACGNLKVPYGKQLVLVINDTSMLSYLPKLNFDDLQGLHIVPLVAPDELAFVGYQTGLKYLSAMYSPLKRSKYQQQLSLDDWNDRFVNRLAQCSALSSMRRLTNLEFLEFIGYVNRDDPSKPYAEFGFRFLTHLTLSRFDIVDIGLLRELKSLQSLEVRECSAVTQLNKLLELPQLRKLYLISTNIENESLEYIENLSNLEELNLSYTQIDDDGLPHLYNLSSLKYLDLSGTKVTRQEIDNLKSVFLPADCEVVWSDPLQDLIDIFDDDFVIVILDMAVSQVNEGALMLEDFSERMESLFEPEDFAEIESYLPLIFEEAKLFVTRKQERELAVARKRDFLTNLKAAEFAAHPEAKGVIKANVAGEEIIRRLWSGVTEEEDMAGFGGLTIKAHGLPDLLEWVNAFANANPKYPVLKKLKELLEQAAKEKQGTVIALIFEPELSRERLHRARYFGANLAESIADYYGAEDYNNLVHDTKTENGKILRKGYDNYFKDLYDWDTEREVILEQFIAKLALGEEKELGLTEDEASEFLKADSEAYVAKNGDSVLDHLMEDKDHVYRIINAIENVLQLDTLRQSVKLTPEEVAGARVAAIKAASEGSESLAKFLKMQRAKAREKRRVKNPQQEKKD